MKRLLLAAALCLAASGANAQVSNSRPGVPYVVCQSAVTGMAVTGAASETLLASCLIPAGSMGLNGSIHVDDLWSFPNSGNNKTTVVRFNTSAAVGGTVYLSALATTSLTNRCSQIIRNRGTANSQIGGPNGTPGCTDTLFSGGAVVTSAIDTSADSYIVFSAAPAGAGETITLQGYTVTIHPGP